MCSGVVRKQKSQLIYGMVEATKSEPVPGKTVGVQIRYGVLQLSGYSVCRRVRTV